MRAKDFFDSEIKDNSFKGHYLNQITKFSVDFNCDTNRKRTSHQEIRKIGIVNFVKELHRNIASKKVSELNLT